MGVALRLARQCHDNGVVDPLSNDKFLDMPKLKVFADDILNVANMTISLYDRAENTLGKGENADYQHFLLFPQCFPKPSLFGSLKAGIVWLSDWLKTVQET